MIEKRCKQCGESFLTYTSEARRGGAQFCSRACMNSHMKGARAAHWQGGQVECVCLTCGETFRVDPNRIAAGRGKHCSKECYWKRARGPNHWHYRDGRGREPYTGGYTPRIRRLVIERDKVCVDCGEWDERPRAMQVHHLDGGKDDHRLENLALLCVLCHSARHHPKHDRPPRPRPARARAA